MIATTAGRRAHLLIHLQLTHGPISMLVGDQGGTSSSDGKLAGDSESDNVTRRRASQGSQPPLRHLTRGYSSTLATWTPLRVRR